MPAAPAATKVRTAGEAGWLTLAGLVTHLDAQGIPDVTRRRVERWVAHPTHPLPSVMVGGRRLVHVADLARWLRDGARGGARIPA